MAYDLYVADCREFLANLEDKSIDAIVTDPPYGLNYPYNIYDDSPENLQALIQDVLPHFLRVSKRVIITPGNTNIWRYPPAKWIGAWTWDTTTSLCPIGWSQWQPILFYGEDVYKGTRSRDGILKSDRIHFNGGSSKHRKIHGKGHSCPKPEAFMDRLVARFTSPGELILDPFVGSGTTGVACVKSGRDFIGIDCDKSYIEIAETRIREALDSMKNND